MIKDIAVITGLAAILTELIGIATDIAVAAAVMDVFAELVTMLSVIVYQQELNNNGVL